MHGRFNLVIKSVFIYLSIPASMPQVATDHRICGITFDKIMSQTLTQNGHDGSQRILERNILPITEDPFPHFPGHYPGRPLGHGDHRLTIAGELVGKHSGRWPRPPRRKPSIQFLWAAWLSMLWAPLPSKDSYPPA